MTDDHDLSRLQAHILPLSRATDFATACKEWSLVEIALEDGNCPCGKAIVEHCYIRNKFTGRETWVGNVCVKRFIGIDTGNCFAGLKRIIDNIDANVNADLIAHAYERGYIYESELKFLSSIKRKRNLSPKQIEWRRKINRRIIRERVVASR